MTMEYINIFILEFYCSSDIYIKYTSFNYVNFNKNINFRHYNVRRHLLSSHFIRETERIFYFL